MKIPEYILLRKPVVQGKYWTQLAIKVQRQLQSIRHPLSHSLLIRGPSDADLILVKSLCLLLPPWLREGIQPLREAFGKDDQMSRHKRAERGKSRNKAAGRSVDRTDREM